MTTYTLKTSGPSAIARMILACDADGLPHEFVSPTVDSQKTTTGITTGSDTWKGTTRGYFSTSTTAGIVFGSTKPTFDCGSGHPYSFFLACRRRSVASGGSAGYEGIAFTAAGSGLITIPPATNKLRDNLGTHDGTTALPLDGSTKFCAGFWHNFVQNPGYKFFFGTEAGPFAADGTGADGGFGSDGAQVASFGWASGLGYAPMDVFFAGIYQGLLSDTDFNNLYTDFFTTSFDVPASAYHPWQGANQMVL